MSFGFSVGDFVAVIGIITSITRSLSETGGSSSEYQELRRQLDLVKKTLQHLDNLRVLDGDEFSASTLDTIKHAALACGHRLQEFEAKIKKHDPHLGHQAFSGRIARTVSQVRWLGKEDDIKKLQRYLHAHLSNINILLSQHDLARIGQLERQTRTNHDEVMQSLQSTRVSLDQVRRGITNQQSTVQTAQDSHSMLQRLSAVLLGEFRASWRSFGDTVTQLVVLTKQMHSLLLEIRGMLSTPVDTRWTYFQQPLEVEDFFGQVFPVPSEYNLELLQAVIKHRFREGPGAMALFTGIYFLASLQSTVKLLDESSELLPGLRIKLAVLVVSVSDVWAQQPRPALPSSARPFTNIVRLTDDRNKPVRTAQTSRPELLMHLGFCPFGLQLGRMNVQYAGSGASKQMQLAWDAFTWTDMSWDLLRC